MLREPFIEVLLGSKWLPMGDVLVWLAPLGFIKALDSSTGSVLMARGRTDTLFYLGIADAALRITGYLPRSPLGGAGRRGRVSLCNGAQHLRDLLLCRRSGTGQGIKPRLRSVLTPMALAAVMVLVVLGCRELLPWRRVRSSSLSCSCLLAHYLRCAGIGLRAAASQDVFRFFRRPRSRARRGGNAGQFPLNGPLISADPIRRKSVRPNGHGAKLERPVFDYSRLIGQFVVSARENRVPGQWVPERIGDWFLGRHPALPVMPLVGAADEPLGWMLGYPISNAGRLLANGDVVQLPAQALTSAEALEAFISAYGGRFAVVVLDARPRLYLDPCGSLSAVYCAHQRMVASTPRSDPLRRAHP